MAAVDNTRTALGQPVGSRLNTLVAAFVGGVKAWNDARHTRNALVRLSDRELEDIGLTRADIADIAATLAK